jgi:hypothetical protein
MPLKKRIVQKGHQREYRYRDEARQASETGYCYRLEQGKEGKEMKSHITGIGKSKPAKHVTPSKNPNTPFQPAHSKKNPDDTPKNTYKKR